MKKKIALTIPQLPSRAKPQPLSSKPAEARRSLQHPSSAPASLNKSDAAAPTQAWDDWRRRCAREIEVLRLQMVRGDGANGQRPVEKRLGG